MEKSKFRALNFIYLRSCGVSTSIVVGETIVLSLCTRKAEARPCRWSWLGQIIVTLVSKSRRVRTFAADEFEEGVQHNAFSETGIVNRSSTQPKWIEESVSCVQWVERMKIWVHHNRPHVWSCCTDCRRSTCLERLRRHLRQSFYLGTSVKAGTHESS